MEVPYAEVIGDPIAHSKSPLIHKFWLEKLNLGGEYNAVRVTHEELLSYFADRRQDPFWRGCNVTLPHKIAVLSLVDTIKDEALHSGAANCILPIGGRLCARSTDGFGVDAALNETFDSACILGTGGAARAAVDSLEVLTTPDIRVVARNGSRAHVLLTDFGYEPEVYTFQHAALALRDVQCVVNATPLGMAGYEPMRREVLDGLRRTHSNCLIFDMVYSPVETELLRQARKLGRRSVDGLTMLIAQADAAFWYFFGAAAPRQHDAELRELLTR